MSVARLSLPNIRVLGLLVWWGWQGRNVDIETVGRSLRQMDCFSGRWVLRWIGFKVDGQATRKRIYLSHGALGWTRHHRFGIGGTTWL